MEEVTMTIIKYICDDCGSEVRSIVKIPPLKWECGELKAWNCAHVAELCKECARKRLDIFTRKGDKT